MFLLVERQCHITYVKVGMFNYCFIRVRDYILVFDMALSVGLGEYHEEFCRLLLFRGYGLVSF